MIDSLPKNVGAYVAFFALAVLVAVLEDTHMQIRHGGAFDFWEMLDAAIVAILPSLTLMFGAMKLPSVGGERPSARIQAKRDSLLVETPAEHRTDAGPFLTRSAQARASGGLPSSAPADPTPPAPLGAR